MRRVLGLAFVFIVLCLYPCLLRAQSTNASISGRVTDPGKAVIADAKVAAINEATNYRYECTTSDSGRYFLAALLPGNYRIEIEKTGFKKLVKPDLILHVQDTLEVDAEMALGSVSDTVTVQAGGPIMDTESATVSTVVDRTFVENIRPMAAASRR